jgi:Chaperone of endosialidase
VALERITGLEHEKIRKSMTIRIKDEKFNPPLYLEARVLETERSYTAKDRDKFVLGNYREIQVVKDATIAQIQSKLFRNENAWSSSARVIRSATPPEDTHAIWIDITKNPEVPMTYDFTTGQWKKASPTVAEEIGAETPTGAQQKAETAKQEAIQVAAEDATAKANAAEQNAKQYAEQTAQQAEQNAKDHANQAAEQAKQQAIQQAIQEAEQKLNQTKTELETEIAAKADATWVNGQLVLKENAITKSSTAPSNPTANQLWLDTSVTPNVLKRWNGSAWVKVTPTSAGEVGAYTKTEVDNALNSKVSVTQYTTDMNGVVTQLNDHESRITQNEQEIATKVSNTTYQQDKTTINNNISQLQTKMSSAETSITQLSNQIALKANASDVYTKQQIDTSLAGKADVSTVSAIEQRVSQAEAQLTVQAGEIASKVSRTEFESLQIGGRNLIIEKKITHGYYVDNSGNLTALQNAFVTDFIDIQGASSIAVSTNGQNNIKRVAFYDQNKVFIPPRFLDTSSKTSIIISVPSNAKYVRFSSDNFASGYFKLEKGNRATDWTPAPEDVQGQIDGLGTRLTTAETSITQLSNQITLKVNQSQYDIDVNNLKSRMSSAESQLTIQAGQIAARVEKNGVISAINQTPEQVKIQANKIALDGYVEAKHIKSLNGLNVNNQFVVDANGNVTFKGTLSGATGTFSGNISTQADINVGNNIYIGALNQYQTKGLWFSDKASVTASRWNTNDHQLTVTGNKVVIVGEDSNGITTNSEIDIGDGDITLWARDGITINANGIDGLNIIGKTTLGGALYTDGTIQCGGFDFRLGTYDQSSRGDTGSSRALVKYSGGKLVINYAKDFYGGVEVQSDLTVLGTARATSFVTTSSAGYKTNIKEFNEDAIAILKDVNVYTYHLISNVEAGIYDKQKVGMLAEAVPAILRDEDGVDTYSIVSVLWKAVQQQQNMIESLLKRIDDLELVLEVVT